jgi:hypothetical protein
MPDRTMPLRYVVKGVVDNGAQIQLTITEEVETEQITDVGKLIEKIEKDERIPDEVKKAILPIFEALETTQPQRGLPIMLNRMTFNIPRRLYEQMDRPNIGDTIVMELKRAPE